MLSVLVQQAVVVGGGCQHVVYGTYRRAAPDRCLEELRTGRVLGVDLNADHLACCVLDNSGNPVGEPVSIAFATEGLAASRRDGRVRAAITALLNLAQRQGCAAVVVENLSFADARATGRETLGRGRRGERLRRTVAGIPTRRFRARLVAMAARRGIAVIGVDAAYTSKWGNQHWRTPLEQQTLDPGHPPSRRGGRDRQTWSRHGDQATAGRTRTGQRTSAGIPPARPDHHPNTTRRCRSPGPPHTPEMCGSTGQRPPRRGQHRSGRTGPTPAH